MKKFIFSITLIMSIIIASVSSFSGASRKYAGKVLFDDISDHWARDIIHDMEGRGIIEVGADKKFFPNKNMIRSEFVPMLHKALGISIAYFKAPDINEFFEDVQNVDAYALMLYDLVIAGIIDYKGKFMPNSAINREEMVHYIMNALRYRLGMVEDKTADDFFADSKKIDSKYRNDVNRAAELKLIKGRGNNKFYPKDKVTRAETLAMISRLLEIINANNKDVVVMPGFEMDGDKYKMKLAITNKSDSEVVINHSSGQKFDFKLLDKDKNVLYTWSADKFFTMALTKTVIGIGETVQFVEELDKNDYKNIVDIAVYLKVFITGKSENFCINAEGYEIKIAD